MRDKYTRTIAPARALAAKTLALECTLSDLVNRVYALPQPEVELIAQKKFAEAMEYLDATQLCDDGKGPPGAR